MNDLQKLLDIAGMTADMIKAGKLVFVTRCAECKIGCLIEPEGMEPFVTCGNVDHPLYWYCADGKPKEGR